MDFYKRVEMCQGINEGSELEDTLQSLTQSATMLRDFDYDMANIVLSVAEKLARDFIKDYIWARECTYEEYVDVCSDEVYAYFTGGAKRLSEEEFHN